MEELAAKARSLGHEDAETFEELARQATRNQGRINIMSLALTVLGGKASDIITKALSKCMKEKDQEKEEAPQNKRHEWQSPLSSLYQPNQIPRMGIHTRTVECARTGLSMGGGSRLH